MSNEIEGTHNCSCISVFVLCPVNMLELFNFFTILHCRLQHLLLKILKEDSAILLVLIQKLRMETLSSSSFTDNFKKTLSCLWVILSLVERTCWLFSLESIRFCEEENKRRIEIEWSTDLLIKVGIYTITIQLKISTKPQDMNVNNFKS